MAEQIEAGSLLPLTLNRSSNHRQPKEKGRYSLMEYRPSFCLLLKLAYCSVLRAHLRLVSYYASIHPTTYLKSPTERPTACLLD